jgi:hypothetical protein
MPMPTNTLAPTLTAIPPTEAPTEVPATMEPTQPAP